MTMRVRSARSLARRTLLAIGVVGVGGSCGALSAACGVGLEAVTPLELASSPDGLLQTAGALVFTYSTREPCSSLVDARASALEQLIAAEPDPSIQRLPMFAGRVDTDRNGSFDGERVEHTFGEVPPNTTASFLVLAVDEDPGTGFTLGDLDGHVFAVGCRAITTTPGKRHGLPITLVAAGLR
jgi:hypothetical protein